MSVRLRYQKEKPLKHCFLESAENRTLLTRRPIFCPIVSVLTAVLKIRVFQIGQSHRKLSMLKHGSTSLTQLQYEKCTNYTAVSQWKGRNLIGSKILHCKPQVLVI